MTDATESVYPDLLRNGLSKLGTLDSRRDLLPLFAALDYFRRDLHAQESVPGVLETTHRYIVGLDLFQVAGFYLVSPTDGGFDLALCGPEDARDRLQSVVRTLIRSRRFAAALREPSLSFFDLEAPDGEERGVLHKLAVPQEVLGMFCGVLHRELPPTNEIAFSLVSLLLGACADAQATMRKTAQLRLEINTLSNLVPICAWCRKIRDDRGYWKQIEDFIHSHSGASFSHGICPECQRNLLARMPSTPRNPPGNGNGNGNGDAAPAPAS